MTNEEYFRVLHQSRNQYSSIIGTSDPDLSLFKARNGKLITWHGLGDQLIFPNGTEDYYKRVAEQVDDVQDFYRYFEAPGVVIAEEARVHSLWASSTLLSSGLSRAWLINQS